MKVRIYDMKTRETIFTGKVKRTNTIESILLKIGSVNFRNGFEKSFKTKAGKAYNYFDICFEVL